MKFLTLIAVAIALSACSKSPVQSAAATPPAYAAPTPAPAPVIQAAPAPLPPPRTDVISVAFKEINEKGYPIVLMTNLTGRDIDDISGGFVLSDSDGNILNATGYTEAVPGTQLLGAGETMEMVPYGLSRKAEPMRRLRAEPENLSFVFEVRSVTFMDEGSSE